MMRWRIPENNIVMQFTVVSKQRGKGIYISLTHENKLISVTVTVNWLITNCLVTIIGDLPNFA